jgi:ATPase involved in DNA repair
VYGVPYLEPDAVRGELPPGQDEIPRGHTGVLGHAAGCIRADAEARGIRRRVVMAHGWVSGGAASESERDISVGGVGQVPAELFAGFGYVALGHLHGQQTIAPQMRYSGSPLPYSFSEASHRKGSWLVDLDGEGTARIEQVPAPVYRRLSVLRGRLADLLGSAAYGQYEDAFVSVTLTDPSRPEGAMDALRARFPHVLVLAFEPEGVLPDQRGYRARTAAATTWPLPPSSSGTSATRPRPRPRNNCWPARSPRSVRKRRRADAPAPAARDRFGAFGGTVEVSFEDLACSGLFLLHGETGAGKTTLLDAIGFALYGRVPGERGKARRLRSDHAAPGTSTEVQLEATLGGRRMRITRKPEQERAKLRGTGTTTEQARVLLEEQAGGSWRAVSTRVARRTPRSPT